MRFERWQGRSALEAFPVSIGLLGACVVFFLATDLVFQGARGESIKLWGMNMQAGFARGELWRPLTAMFLHGGLVHVALNMWGLWQLCPALERTIGSARFSAIYFGAGLAGSLASTLLEPASLGASGAICGVMATYVRFERVRLGSFRAVLRDPVGSQFLVWLLINIALGFSIARVSNAGHIGGMLGGWAVSAAVIPALTGRDRGRLSSRPSLPMCAGVVLALLLLGGAAFRPFWSAGFIAHQAAAGARGDEAAGLRLVEKARQARLGRDADWILDAGIQAHQDKALRVAEALYMLADERGCRRPELAHNQALLIQKRGDLRALLAHLRLWKSRLGEDFDDMDDVLEDLEAREARGELGR